MYFQQEKGVGIRRLVGNVIYKQKGTTVYCDSSRLFPKDNRMVAYGHVKIIDDSTTITSKRAAYYGNSRLAKLRENVVYVRGTRRLYTDSLDYMLDTDVAKYFAGGKLVDTTNTLTSDIGFFYARQNQATFFGNVLLVSPDRTIKTDTLTYNTVTKIAKTKGPTEITTEDGTQLFSKGGEFRSYVDQSQFIEGTVETDDYILEGDGLFFDDLNKYYKSDGNVVLTSKNEDIIITGDEGYYDRSNGVSKIYGSPIMKRILEKDTFYLAADTLIAIESDYDTAKRVLAYYEVEMFKSNLQGLCDSVAYFLSDSMIYMYRDPILWTTDNQIEGDTILLEIADNTLKQMELHQNSMMVSQDTLTNFNQIKGRMMYAYFRENDLDNIRVVGNGESVFYSLNNTYDAVIGVNRMVFSSMKMRFKNNDIDNISFYTKPEGKFVPPHELTEDVQRLQGFAWKGENRPTLEDIYRKRIPGQKKSRKSNELNESLKEENEKIQSLPEKGGKLNRDNGASLLKNAKSEAKAKKEKE